MRNDTKNTVHNSDRSPIQPKRIIIVAEHRVGHGSGHLHRCARIVPRLDGAIDWLLPNDGADGYYSRREALEMIGNPDLPVRWVDQPNGPYDMAIFDRREATLDELRSLNVTGLCVGIDLAGEARRYCSFVIDALETPPGEERPNIADPGLLHLPTRVRNDWPEEIRRVLIAFGGENSGAGVEIASALAEDDRLEVTIVAREKIEVPEGVSVLIARGNLPELLADYDAIVTHYGLTPYEATWARVPAILVNPSRYHSALAKEAGFVEAHGASEIASIIAQPRGLIERCERVRPRGTSDIAKLINDLHIPERSDSPAGSDRWQPAIERFGERTFFRDDRDGLVYMQNYRAGTVHYDHDYFFSEYARQYGRTYLEDFPAIREVGARRIRDIQRRFSVGHTDRRPRLLDLGCAYGPFMQAASDAGFDVCGLDISSEATEYVEKELGFTAICGDIRTVPKESFDGDFDIVTMWYVIEHFQELDLVLGRVGEILRPGGLFAFSTPNGAGISAKKDFREFCRRSPIDHFTIMTPKTAAATLRRFGFVPRGVRVTGHHPERFDFVSPGKKSAERGVRYRLTGLVSRIARLGDTFEMVAEYRP
jgi:2-polyprenyl-3-methyl-5-hydroxy-6-metoxy-1,4-benzoquinol methylase